MNVLIMLFLVFISAAAIGELSWFFPPTHHRIILVTSLMIPWFIIFAMLDEIITRLKRLAGEKI